MPRPQPELKQMSTLPSPRGPSDPVDPPRLRLFKPEAPDPDALTLAEAHRLYRMPALAKKSKGHLQDCMRALAKWAEFEAADLSDGQRIGYPLPVSAITSSVVRRFQCWLAESTTWGPSSINKAVREVLATLALAGDEGLEVRPARCKRIPEPTGAKIYLDELQIACLWSAAEGMSWPAKESRLRTGSTFTGTGLPPSTFWRATLILLRTYGMRVQDLVAYERDKIPITWADICFDPRTPNPHGREEWALGWLYYQSGKVGRKYYLPLTRHTRAAVDRLRAAAELRAKALGLDHVPSDWPILPCPHGGGLPRVWKTLCDAARVSKPIKLIGVEPDGDKWVARTNVSERRFSSEREAQLWLEGAASYVLEDFRSTAATFYATIEKTLPNKICGWADGEKKNVGRTNYINDEPFLLKYLPGSYQAGERFFLTEAEAVAWENSRARDAGRGRQLTFESIADSPKRSIEYHPAAPIPRCFDDWL